MTDALLPGVDPDLVRPLEQRLRAQVEGIHLDTRVTQVEERTRGLRVTFEGKAGKAPAKTYDRVLVAVGRQPNTADLGLETTRVQVDDAGFIRIDPQRRTAEPG